jgi:FMN reductase
MPQISVVVGNPSPNSRTSMLAQAVACAVLPDFDPYVIDLANYSADMFNWDSAELALLNQKVAESDIIIVASPTYKAAYTGLLKAFLDRYDHNGLAGVTAILVMTGGSPAHSLAPDVTLRPLLVELGASVPTRSLYFLTSQMDDMNATVAEWAQSNRLALRAVLREETI